MTNQTNLMNTIRLDVPATFKYLHVVSACLHEFVTQEQNVAQQEIASHDVQLAVQEICTNVIRHAYLDNHENERISITITLQLQPRSLVIHLFDKGIAFDESKVKEPDLEAGQVHGYGLFLVKNLMDIVTYSRQQDSNCWRLVKSF